MSSDEEEEEDLFLVVFFLFFFLCRPLPSQNRQQEGSQWLLSLRLLNERLISFRTLSDYKCVCVCVTQAARQHTWKTQLFAVTPVLPVAAFLR